MKVSIFISDDGPESREMQDLGTRLKENGKEVVEYTWDEDETTSLANLYDIHSTPALLVTTDDGRFIELWQGDIPAMTDVIYRAGNA